MNPEVQKLVDEIRNFVAPNSLLGRPHLMTLVDRLAALAQPAPQVQEAVADEKMVLSIYEEWVKTPTELLYGAAPVQPGWLRFGAACFKAGQEQSAAPASPPGWEADAKRYRWLRDYAEASDWEILGYELQSEMDARVDELMTAAPNPPPGAKP